MKHEAGLQQALAVPSAALHEEMWLLGQAPLQKYLDFADDRGVDAAAPRRAGLVAEWRAAAAYYEELEDRERGIADRLGRAPLAPALQPLAAQLMNSARFTRTFDSLPTQVQMVELGRLVLCQNHVTRSFVDELKARLGPDPEPAALFRFCLPMGDAPAPVQIRKVGSRRYVFRSDSTDFRFHESVLLQAGQLNGYDAYGAVSGVVGLVVGYSSNFLNAVCDDDSQRLLLHNGYHRACALLELGITHAPCVVQTVSCRDELDIVAKPIVANDPGYFFNGPRPPLLKDFADPRIRKLLPVKKLTRMIEVNFEVKDYFVEE